MRPLGRRRGAGHELWWLALPIGMGIGVAVLSAAPAAGLPWTVLARSGDSVPGLPAGEVLRSVGSAVLSVQPGKVVFEARWGAAYHDAFVAWTDAGGLSLAMDLDASSISVEGTDFTLTAGFHEVGGTGLATVDRFADIPACPARDSIYPEEVTFVEDGTGGFAPVLAPGAPAPGAGAGWSFDAPSPSGSPASNAAGDLAFVAWIRQAADPCDPDPSTPYASAIFGPDGAGSYTLAAIDEEPAPGAGDGAALLVGGSVQIDAAGGIAFDAQVRLGPSGPTVPAIYAWDVAHGLRLVTLTYGPEPVDATTSGTFRLRSGQVGFLNYPGTALSIDDGTSGAELRIAAGDPAPGLPAGFTFTDFGHGFIDAQHPELQFQWDMNGLGDVAFTGHADFAGSGEPSRFGLWGPDASGALVLRLAVGDAAPLLPGATIGSTPRLLALSDRRELLVQVSPVGPAGTPGSVTYLIDADGRARFLIQPGQQIELTPGTAEPFTAGPLAFDRDLEHFAFVAHATLPPLARSALVYGEVPEAGTSAGALAAVASLVVLRRRRRA